MVIFLQSSREEAKSLHCNLSLVKRKGGMKSRPLPVSFRMTILNLEFCNPEHM